MYATDAEVCRRLKLENGYLWVYPLRPVEAGDLLLTLDLDEIMRLLLRGNSVYTAKVLVKDVRARLAQLRPRVEQ